MVRASPTRTSSHGPESIPSESPTPTGKFREFFLRFEINDPAAGATERQNWATAWTRGSSYR